MSQSSILAWDLRILWFFFLTSTLLSSSLSTRSGYQGWFHRVVWPELDLACLSNRPSKRIWSTVNRGVRSWVRHLDHM